MVWRTSRTVLRLRAHLWRLMLRRTTFIGITGSIGKTTTKECLAGILSTQHRIAMTRYNRNGARGVPRTILWVKRQHRYAVVKIGTDIPGQIQRSAAIVRPKIAIILTVARTHTDNFKALEDTAAEKSRLLDFVPADGIAILNADDPRVIAMAAKVRCAVKTFGRSPKADIWAEEVTSKWPARLSFRARMASESEWVATNFVGGQWVNSVLAALSCIREKFSPVESDVWLLAPADMPRLDPVVIKQVMAAHDPASPAIIVPTSDGKRGHPVLFPWAFAFEVASLSECEGVNVLLERFPVRELICNSREIHGDLDTPEDYNRLSDEATR